MSKLVGLGVDFEEFVQGASPDLLRLAVLLTADRGEAEDLVQTALVRTAGRWKTARNSPKSYARQVLVNLARDRWRNRARRPFEAQDLTGVEMIEVGQVEVLVERDRVATLLARLPLAQRKVLVLRYFEDLPVSEVAALLGCGEGTVKSRTHRALSTLRDWMAAEAAHSQEEPHAFR